MTYWRLLGLLFLIALSGCKMLGLSDDKNIKPKPAMPAATGTPSKLAWQVDIGKASRVARLSPIVVGEHIYAASEGGRVLALTLAGTTVWDIKVNFNIFGGVGADDRLVVIGGKKGEIAAFDARTGKEVWRSMAVSEVVAPPIVSDQLVIIRTLDGRIFGLDREDGKRRWVYQRIMPSLILRSAAPMTLAEGYLFIGYPGGKLIALQQERGALVMEESVSTPRGDTELERLTDISSRPIILGSEVCVGAYQGRVGCFNLRTGDPTWFRDISTAAGLDMDEQGVYVAADDGYLYALDRHLGTERWKADILVGGLLAQPVVVNETVVVGDAFGFLHFLSTTEGTLLGRVPVDNTPFTAAPILLPNGGLLVQTTGGKLSAFMPQ